MASSPPSLDKSTGPPVLQLMLKTMLSPLLLMMLLLLPSGGNASRCEILTDPFCKDMGYNHTMFPNTLSHTTHAEAQLEMSFAIERLQVYHPDSTCHRRTRKLICWMFFPPCSIIGVPPCRETCESVRDYCQQEGPWVGHPGVAPPSASGEGSGEGSGSAVEGSGSAGEGSGAWTDKCDGFPEPPAICISTDWPAEATMTETETETTTETPTFAGNMSWTNTSWLFEDSPSGLTQQSGNATFLPEPTWNFNFTDSRFGLTQMSGNATFLPDPTWDFNFTDSLPMSTERPSMSTTSVPDLGPFQAFWSALSQAGAVEEGSAGEMPVQVMAMMAEMFARFGRIQQLQEEKLELEIRLLQRQLLN